MKCTECGQAFEPHNPGVHQTVCDNCDYRHALMLDTVNRILEGRLGRFDVKFSWFRQQVLDEFPDPIDDDEIHALFLEHVSKPTKGDFDAFGVEPPSPAYEAEVAEEGLRQFQGLTAESPGVSLGDEGPAGDELRRKQALVNERLAAAAERNQDWRNWSAPTTGKSGNWGPKGTHVEQPSKPLADRTLGEIADAVTKKARAFVRIALGSRRT